MGHVTEKKSESEEKGKRSDSAGNFYLAFQNTFYCYFYNYVTVHTLVICEV